MWDADAASAEVKEHKQIVQAAMVKLEKACPHAKPGTTDEKYGSPTHSRSAC